MANVLGWSRWRRIDDENDGRVWTGNPTFARIFFMTMLPDGNYDVIVVDTERGDDGDLRIEVTISLGT
jgi:hypothetical protein